MGKKDTSLYGLTRRHFLIGTAGLAGMALLPRRILAAPPEPLPILSGYRPTVAGAWIPKGEQEKSFGLLQNMSEAATDFSWLSRGDRVLLKLAMNSGLPYPRTTDPWLLDSMIRILQQRGAKVVVGDSAGCGHVRWSPTEKKGSSRALCDSLGLLKIVNENGASPVFFEEKNYDSFLETLPAGKHHWKTPLRIASEVKEVDHIVYLPRVSSHVLGEVTLGMKLGVGFLREDSRLALHEGAGDFCMMWEEISHVPEISSRLRLCVSTGRSVTTLVGPDVGPVAVPDYGLILASTDLLAHDLPAYAFLKWNREYMTSPQDQVKDGILTRNRAERNKGFLKRVWKLPEGHVPPNLEFFQAGVTGGIYDHPAVINFMKRKGGRPETLNFVQLNKNPQTEVVDYLKREMKI
jgi:uncharacterized protein (DUF362 family)